MTHFERENKQTRDNKHNYRLVLLKFEGRKFDDVILYKYFIQHFAIFVLRQYIVSYIHMK